MHKLIYDFVPVELITSFIVYLSFREQLEEIVKMMMVPEFKLLTPAGRESEREKELDLLTKKITILLVTILLTGSWT